MPAEPISIQPVGGHIVRKLALVLQLLAAPMSIGASLRYLTSSEFMPYHATVAGQAWAALSPGLQVIISGMLHILGAGFLGCGVAIAALAIPVWRAERWAAWATLLVGLAVWAPTLFVTLALKAAAPTAQPPTAPTIAILILVVAATIASLASRPDASPDLPAGVRPAG